MTKSTIYYAYAIPHTQTKGITDTWEKCKKIVSGKPGATYKGFKTKQEAAEWLKGGADYTLKKTLAKGIYFDAGTGRGEGVEISVTDKHGKNLLQTILPKKYINRHGKYTLGHRVTNNYGELLACKYALQIALRDNIMRVFGDSNLIISYWSKGLIKKEVPPQTIDLAHEVSILRRTFESKGGIIAHISGDDNPADLGFHR